MQKSADSNSRNDLEDLFLFQTNNSDKMPFYVFNKNEVENISNVSEKVYDALCNAVDYLTSYPDEIEKYFGQEFCKKYPEFLKYAIWTYNNNHNAIYGRFDMAFNPQTGSISGVYEFNGNTPVMLFESTVLENWLVTSINEMFGTQYDQHNQYYYNTINGVKKLILKNKKSINVGILYHSNYIEDSATSETVYNLFDSIEGINAYIDDINNIEYHSDYLEKCMKSPFVISGVEIDYLFVLHPWEEIVESCYDNIICKWQEWKDHIKFFEPAWRWFVSNKGIWPLITYLKNNSDEPMMMEASCLAIREFDKPVLDIKNERFIPHLIVN